MRQQVLHSLRSRLLAWHWASVCIAAIGVAITGALGFVLSDAALALSDSLRSRAPFFVGLGMMLVIVAGALQLRWFSAARVARRFEQFNPAIGTKLTNALEMAQRTGATPIEEYLRQETVLLGQTAAIQEKTWPVIRRKIGLALAFVGSAAAGWCLLFLAGAEVYEAVVPRFTDPFGDHPPFSRVYIEVAPKSAEVLYGGQMEIRATTLGRPVDKLWLVARSGTNVSRTIMFLSPDKSFFQTLANLREPTEFFVTDGRARSYRYPIRVRYTPQITLAEVSMIYPEYTGRPAQTMKLSEQPQAVPADTQVQFRIASNRPLKSGKVVITPVLGGKPSDLLLERTDNESVVAGSFSVAEAVLFHINVEDVDGLPSQEPRQGRFNIQPDDRPRLYVLEPGRDAVATPETKIPVRVQAQDDYGIARVVWLRSHNGSTEHPFTLKADLKDGARSVEAVTAFDLGSLGVYPGDVIEYYFEAADNYPKGPNVALSKMYRLEIISKEQYERILRQQAARKALFESYFKAGNWFRRLAETARKINQLAESGASRDAINNELNELNKQLADYQEALDEILKQAPMFDIESLFHDTLEAQRNRASQLQKVITEGLQQGGLPADTLKRVGEELTDMAENQEENVVEPAEQIAAVTRLLAKADKFTKLAREEATLARLLRRFTEKETLSRIEQMEVQELAHQQRRIHTELQEIISALPTLAGQLPTDEKFDELREDVASFLEAVAEARVEEDTRGAAESLGIADAVNAYALANAAAEKMDELIARCNSMPGLARRSLKFQPTIQQSMGNTLEQIMAAMGLGDGGQGGDGYSMFNDQTALYGPGMEMQGEQRGGGADSAGGSGFRSEQLAGDAQDEGLKGPETPGRVRLQPNAKFPMRYRDLVGEYFRVIAESLEGEIK